MMVKKKKPYLSLDFVVLLDCNYNLVGADDAVLMMMKMVDQHVLIFQFYVLVDDPFDGEETSMNSEHSDRRRRCFP